jgi:2-polyprenyl-3-methyl-5-hydroxy-6-metoxy-1,4-benzoquinol methylase
MNCPVCYSDNVHHCFPVKDHSVTGEEFLLMECKSCTLRFTSPIPSESKIGSYYESQDYISHTDQQRGITGYLYRIVRKWTLTNKANLIIRVAKKKIGMHIDIGAGTGAFVHTMEKAGWNTIGFEPDEKARKRANKLYKVSVYPIQDFFQLPNEGGYDVITLWHALEHIHQLHETVAKMEKLLSPKGKIFIAVPNYQSYDAKHYKSYWAAYDVPRHLYHFSVKSMRVLLEKHNLKLKSYRAMWFDSFYVSLLSEKYKRGNIFSAFFYGLLSNLKALSNKKECSSLIYIAERIHEDDDV